MTEIAEEVREGSPPETASLPGEAESAQRANSITPAASVTRDAVTQSGRAAWRLTMATVAAADRAGSLPDAQPKTLRQARAWHHRCAGHYKAAGARWPRLVWGYVHMTFAKPALNFTEWVTESPIRSVVAGVVAIVTRPLWQPPVLILAHFMLILAHLIREVTSWL